MMLILRQKSFLCVLEIDSKKSEFRCMETTADSVNGFGLLHNHDNINVKPLLSLLRLTG